LTLSTKVSGSYHTAQANVKVSGVWKFALLWTKVSGIWKQISGSLSVTAPDVNVNDSGIGIPHTVSGSTTITPSGTVGPYTYLTTFVSGDNTATTSGLTTSTPGFSKSFSPASGAAGILDAVWRATVTDGFGNSAHHDFAVHLEYDRA
jgi:hypothetical protein